MTDEQFKEIYGAEAERVGRQVEISKIDKFDFLLKNRISVTVQHRGKGKSYTVNCPRPSAFLYHKGATFIDREDAEKQAKDLYYIYFILRYAPDVNEILKEVAEYCNKGYLAGVAENINSFFERLSSPGCLLVEDENGADEYIHNVRQDIFDRFKDLRKVLQPQ